MVDVTIKHRMYWANDWSAVLSRSQTRFTIEYPTSCHNQIHKIMPGLLYLEKLSYNWYGYNCKEVAITLFELGYFFDG